MELVMCLSCGKFSTATREDGRFVPSADECPSCGGAAFRHNGSETTIRTGRDGDS